MKLLGDAKSVQTVLRRLLTDYREIRIAVAWATENPLSEMLVEHRNRIRHLVIGTDFYQTSPDLLASFKDDSKVGMVLPDGSGTFHPKIYLFSSPGDGKWACIIGSPNFTNAAMTRNSECAILISSEDDSGGRILSAVKKQIESYRNRAVKITAERLASYRQVWKVRRPRIEAAARAPAGRTPDAPVGQLDEMTWARFVGRVKRDPNLMDRLLLLNAVREMLMRSGSFARLSREERQVVAGMRKSFEWGGTEFDPRAFGSMWNAGRFKQAVVLRFRDISLALREIPLRGEVRKGEFDEFVRRMRALGDGIGLTSITRLLAVVRPDTFVCIDSVNRERLGEGFGSPPSMFSVDTYWDDVVLRIRDSVWWNARRPVGERDSAIWEGRAALLDSLCYQPAQ